MKCCVVPHEHKVIATVWLFAKYHLIRLLYALKLQGIGGRSIYQNISSSPKFASDKLSDRGSLNIGYIVVREELRYQAGLN